MKKLTIEYVKDIFLSKGFECLSCIYENAHKKLQIKCPNGHISDISWRHFIKGHGCSECAGNKRKTIEYIREFSSSFGYICLSDKYFEAFSRLIFKCPCGNEFSATWDSFNSGKRCPKCSGNKKKTIEEIKKYAISKKFECLSNEYTGAHHNLQFRCPEGHCFPVSWNNFSHGCRCPICCNHRSNPEFDIIGSIKEYCDLNVTHGDRSTIKNPQTNRYLELDIYIPKINLAIEFNGWHHRNITKTIERDIIKIAQCQAKGIELLIIDDVKDWGYNKKDSGKKERALENIKKRILELMVQLK